MKKSAFIFLLLAAAFSVKLTAQKKGGIYDLTIMVDKELTEEVKVTNSSRKVLNGVSESDIMPQSVIDSIKAYTERSVAAQMNCAVSCIYKVKKNGDSVMTLSVTGMVERMPTNTFNNAVENNPGLDYYISVRANIYPSGGYSIDFGNKKVSKVKPKMDIKITVYDRDKKEVWEGKATMKNFAKLRQEQKRYGVISVTKSETLSPEDIATIFLMGVDKAFGKIKEE